MKKTLVSFILTFILLVTVTSLCTFAAEADFTTAEYTYISADGTETVGLEVTAYNGSDTDIYIPSKIGDVPVLKVGDNFLAGNTSVNSVTLGAGIKEIGAGAFSGASNMVCALLNEDIEVIGADAFSNMPVFNSIILWDSITNIGDGAFVNCPTLTVYCNEATAAYTFVTSNGIDYEILNPEAEPDVCVVDGVTYYIQNGKAVAVSFDESTSNVIMPEHVKGYPVTEIRSAFKDSDIISIKLPSSITRIGDYAFYGCNKLSGVSLFAGITSIGAYAFEDCWNLERLDIPNSVKNIGFAAFQSCRKLTIYCNEGTIAYEYAIDNEIDYAILNPEIEIKKYYIDGVTYYIIDSEANATDFDNSVADLEIPSSIDGYPVTDIRTAFKESDITSIVLPDTVKSLRDNVFYGCYYLSNVTLPDSITNIGEYAFCYCKNLTDLKIPEKVTYIGAGAFSNSGIKNINIPKSMTKIENDVFSYCGRLATIEIPNSITSIGAGAFESTSLTSIVIPDSVTNIDSYAFSNCLSLRDVTIPKNVTSIESSVFFWCSSLQNIKLPYGVTSIESCAFEHCDGLTNIEIPHSVTRIESGAFRDCVSLLVTIVPESVTDIQTSSFDTNTLLCVYDNSKAHELAINNHLPYCVIDEGYDLETKTFSDMTYLLLPDSAIAIDFNSSENNVTIPETVEDRPVTELHRTFYRHVWLTSVDIPDSVQKIGNHAFDDCFRLASVELPENLTSIGDYAFRSCTSLKNVEIPDGVTSIGKFAFDNCTNLLSVTIPLGAEHIGNSAFINCSALTSIDVPKGITSIGESAFYGCSNLKSVYITEVAAWCDIDFGNVTSTPLYNGADFYINNEIASEIIIPSEITNIKNYTFYKCSNIKKISIPEGITSIGKSAFYGCTNLTSVEIPEGVVSIGNGAFDGCTGLAQVIVPKSVTTLSQDSFDENTVLYVYQNSYAHIFTENNKLSYEVISIDDEYTVQIDGITYTVADGVATVTAADKSLTSVVIPEFVDNCPVTKIGNGAFYECHSLNSIELPDSIESIGDNAFSYCSFNSIQLPNSITSIGGGAFSFTRLESIKLPDGLTSIEDFAFGLSCLTSIEIPDSVSSIGKMAFVNTYLTNIVIPGSVKSIGAQAFMECDNLTSVTFKEGVTSLEIYAFWYCDKLTSVSLPESLTKLDHGVFGGCTALKSVVIPKSVNDMQPGTFEASTVLYVYENSYAHDLAVYNDLLFNVIVEPEISYVISITGTVTYTDGTPAVGATVALFYDNGKEKETVITDENGEYSFTYAEVERYIIRATDDDNNTDSEQVSVKRKNVFDVILTGETDLVLKKSYNVNVYVEGDAPITVALYEDGLVNSETITNNGTAVFENITNGEYVIKAVNAYGSALATINVFNKDVDVYLVIEGDHVTLFGKVVVKDRENEEHEREWAQVTVYNSDGVVVATGKTDENGNYSFAKLPVGEYTVKAEVTEMREDEYYDYIRPHVLKGYAYADALEAGEYEVETIVLTEEESERVLVAGKVTAQGEHQECQVILMNENRDELARYSTNRNGKYQFDNLGDGYYILCAITENDGAGFAEITVKDGIVYGETDIRVYKSDRVSAHETIMLEIHDCETADEAEQYRETVTSEKNFYDSLPDKEKKMFSQWYIEKLDKLVQLLSGYEFTCDGAEVTNGGLIVSEEEVSTGANPHFTISVVETESWRINENGIETDEDYYQTFVEEAAGDNELAQYYDITLECEKNGKIYEITDIKKHTDTTGKIRLTMPIPDKFKGHKNYAFVHVHNGVPTTLVDLDDNPDTITFEIDRFSTFALMYNDEEQADLSDYATLSITDGVLTATSTTDATLFVATYEDSGRMSDVKLTTLKADIPVHVVVEAGQKAFVLDSTMLPLCEEVVVG